MNIFVRRPCRLGGACLAFLVALSVGPAVAQGPLDAPPLPITIPAQPLADAIVAFNAQTGVEIVAPAGIITGRLSAPVGTTSTPATALDAMLRGTGLVYDVAPSGEVVLRGPASPAIDGGPAMLDPLTVTARRTEELLQDVPGSVAVLSEDELERSNIDNAAEAIIRLPNVSFLDNSDPADLDLSIRGISNVAGGAVSSPTNGVFADGILLNPTGNPFGVNATLVDIERVEVAFGPQGTAFGRGTIGGAINFVTNKPTDEFEASFETEVGSFPDGRATAIVNAPVLEDGLLSARLVAFGGISDGFVDFAEGNDPDSVGRNDVGGRLSLRSRPTNRLTLDASVSFDRIEFDASNTLAITNLEDDDLVTGDFVAENALERTLASLQWSYDFDVGSLRSTTSFFQTDLDTFDDLDFTALDLAIGTVALSERAIAQEFRFESESFDLPSQNGEVAFNLGLSTSYNEFENNNITDLGADAFAAVGERLGLGPLPDDGSTIVSNSELEVFNVGIFGDVRWRPIRDLEIVAGARFSLDRVSREGETVSTGNSALANPSVPFASGEATFTAVTPNASINYDWTEDFSTYLAFSTGFRPGGFGSSPFGFSSFEEERVRSFEGGFRASLLDNRLLVNGSGYVLDYDDIQVSVSETAGGITVVTTDNAAAARSVGAEIGISALPTDNLRLDAQIGLSFTEFTDYTDSPFGDLTDTRLPNAPVHTFSIVGDYEHPREMLPGTRAFARAEYSLRSSFSEDLNPDTMRFDGFDILNLRLGLRGERLAFEAFVENVLDETYATGSSAGTFTATAGIPRIVDVGPPRRFGVRARMRF